MSNWLITSIGNWLFKADLDFWLIFWTLVAIPLVLGSGILALGLIAGGILTLVGDKK